MVHRKTGKFFESQNSLEKGQALFYTLVIMGILLSVGLALSALLVGQLRIITGIGDSVIAFYAADSGMEKALLNRDNPLGISGSLENGATYIVTVSNGGQGDCDADYYCIRSVGTYREISRAIEAEY